MNHSNRDHANTPSRLTAVDHARQRAAILRHERAIARARRNEALKGWGCAALVVALVYTFAPAIIASATGAARAFGVL